MSLLGVRVLWRIKSEYLNCQFTSLRVQLNSIQQTDVTINDSSADFYNLDCNTWYIPRVRGVSAAAYTDVGDRLFYGGIVHDDVYSVMCQLPTGTNYRKSCANYRHIVYVWSTDKFTERGRAISGRSIEAYPPVFDFARFLDSDALSKAIYHSLGCK